MTESDMRDQCQKNILAAAARLPSRNPADPKERDAIIADAKKCLGFNDDNQPAINYRTVGVSEFSSYKVEHQSFDSWSGVKGASNLYLPKGDGPYPWVLLCCGHGDGGKLSSTYQAMARYLAMHGIAVLVPDNIGQGERITMGHWNAASPFKCGLSLQGLILHEFLAHIRAAREDCRFDSLRLSAIGNSGGGLATCFLAALADELSVLVSSGYPSTFEFIARKEKVHCCCNILPSIVGLLEMWHLYGCFAPKPILLFQGEGDPLFPPDLFRLTSHRTASTYNELNARDNFNSAIVSGGHSWDENRINLTVRFLCETFNLDEPSITAEVGRDEITRRNLEKWSEEFLDVPRLASQLSGEFVDQCGILDLFPTSDCILEDATKAFMIQTKLLVDVRN